MLHSPGTTLHSPAPATGRCSRHGTGDCTVTAARSPRLCSLPYTQGTPTRNLHRTGKAKLSKGGENDAQSSRLRTHHPSPLPHHRSIPVRRKAWCSAVPTPSPHLPLPFCFPSTFPFLSTLNFSQPLQGKSIQPTLLFFCVNVTEPLQLSAHFEMFYASNADKIQVPRKRYTELPGSTLCRTPWSRHIPTCSCVICMVGRAWIFSLSAGGGPVFSN